VSDVTPGWIVVLNGPPRSGKSSIVDVIQATFDGPWLNLGVDVFSPFVTPPRLRPGIGLRPGGGEHACRCLAEATGAAGDNRRSSIQLHGCEHSSPGCPPRWAAWR